jgi:hypothetical protein
VTVQALSSMEINAAPGNPIPVSNPAMIGKLYLKGTAGVLHSLKGVNLGVEGYLFFFDVAYVTGANPDLFDTNEPAFFLPVPAGGFEIDWGETGRPFANGIAMAFTTTPWPYNSSNIENVVALDIVFE